MTNASLVTPEPADALSTLVAPSKTKKPPKYTGAWWADTADRVISTGAQSAIGVLGVGVTGILDVQPIALASVVGLAMAVSLLKALATR